MLTSPNNTENPELNDYNSSGSVPVGFVLAEY